MNDVSIPNLGEMERAILAAADASLSEIFNDTGKRSILYHLRSKHGVTLPDLIQRPDAVRVAFESLLGSLGSGIVWERMTRSICEAVPPSRLGRGSGPGDSLLDHLCAQPFARASSPKKV